MRAVIATVLVLSAAVAQAEKFYLATLADYHGSVRYFQRYQKGSRPLAGSDKGSLHLKAGDRFQVSGSAAVVIRYRDSGSNEKLTPARESDGNSYCYVDARPSSEQLALTSAIHRMTDPRITKRNRNPEPVFSPAEDDTVPLAGLTFLRSKDHAEDSKLYLLSWRAREYDEVALPAGTLSVDGSAAAKTLEQFRHDDKPLTLYLSHSGQPQEQWRVFHIMSRNDEKKMMADLADVDEEYADDFERLIASANVHIEYGCVGLAEQDLVAALKVRSYPELVDKVKEFARSVGDIDSANQLVAK